MRCVKTWESFGSNEQTQRNVNEMATKKTAKKKTKKASKASPAIPKGAQPLKIPKSPRTLLIASIQGTTPLVTHRFPEKAKRQIREKQQNVAKLPKGKRNPQEEFEESVYIFDDGGYGFPTGALAESIVGASVDVMPKCKSMIRRNLFVEDDGFDGRDDRGLIRVDTEPLLREDVVRLAGASRPADLRYRGGYAPGWEATARIWFDERMLSREQVIQLVQIAGESIGLCEGRPEKTLSMGWGKFQITAVHIIEPEKPLKIAS